MKAKIIYIDEAHFDITGTNYKEFLDKCFKYSTYFSLVSSRCAAKYREKYKYIFDELAIYNVLSMKVYSWPGNIILQSEKGGHSQPVDYKVFKCCEETKTILESNSPSLFSWCDGRPEDLTFYYQNAKIFLYTVSHEGDCVISCSPDIFDDFSSFNTWQIISQNEYLNDIYF